ncbi:MAG TPA: non-homologous end-joining DNA ligase [Kofleriaceae bacterium]|nr:non-homologous end-joining DNA ligase [Kofleriaceae bacterium]
MSLEYIFDDITIACTNVDRVMWPDEGITKAELIGYYHYVADYMLPELRERPLSVERYTKGVDRGGFFQKHYQKHYPAWLDKVEAGTKTRVVYPIVNTTAGLVYMANQGSIAFHVWTSRRETLEYPDLIVFDLDPPEGKLDLVRQTALILRELFEQLELPAFVKTTGGKGLHVVAPTDGRASYGEVMAFCNRVAKLLCDRYPDLMTIEFYKKDRKGRLYLDTMRNALGATIIAPYSVRGRPGAPIAMPIEWAEVEDPAMAPNGFRLRDIRKRIGERGDPWATLRDRVGSLDDAEAALERLR